MAPRNYSSLREFSFKDFYFKGGNETMSYQKIKGTLDFYQQEATKMRFIETKAKEILKTFGFEESITPIIEMTDVFVRSSGENSDIVNKEMYTFLDRGNRSITLRPEGTASIVRSFLENKLYINSPVTKLYYCGPMFRYERPQKGRYRQFMQFGIEVFGEESPFLDADVIISAYTLLSALGIKGIKLKINTIGDFASRVNYTAKLQSYFADKIDDFCEDCKQRLTKNPLRILDCKVDSEKDVVKRAPKIKDSLSDASLAHFIEVTTILSMMKIPYEVEDTLVRGLDYYTDTVFEFILDTNDDLQGLAICGGGRYADLVKNFGGPDISGIGYAFGLERIMMVMTNQNLFTDIDKKTDVFIISLDKESKRLGLEFANQLREEELVVEMDYKNYTLKQQFKLTEKLNPKFIIIIGEEERENNIFTIKDTQNNTQEKVKKENIVSYIKSKKQ